MTTPITVDQYLDHIQTILNCTSGSLDRLIAGLTETTTPWETLGWSGEAFEHAAKMRVVGELKLLAARGGDLATLRAVVLKQAIEGARNAETSTCPIQNHMKRCLTMAWGWAAAFLPPA